MARARKTHSARSKREYRQKYRGNTKINLPKRDRRNRRQKTQAEREERAVANSDISISLSQIGIKEITLNANQIKNIEQLSREIEDVALMINHSDKPQNIRREIRDLTNVNQIIRTARKEARYEYAVKTRNHALTIYENEGLTSSEKVMYYKNIGLNSASLKSGFANKVEMTKYERQLGEEAIRNARKR